MKEKRLNKLGILNIENDSTTKIKYKYAMNTFTAK